MVGAAPEKFTSASQMTAVGVMTAVAAVGVVGNNTYLYSPTHAPSGGSAYYASTPSLAASLDALATEFIALKAQHGYDQEALKQMFLERVNLLSVLSTGEAGYTRISAPAEQSPGSESASSAAGGGATLLAQLDPRVNEMLIPSLTQAGALGLHLAGTARKPRVWIEVASTTWMDAEAYDKVRDAVVDFIFDQGIPLSYEIFEPGSTPYEMQEEDALESVLLNAAG